MCLTLKGRYCSPNPAYVLTLSESTASSVGSDVCGEDVKPVAGRPRRSRNRTAARALPGFA